VRVGWDIKLAWQEVPEALGELIEDQPKAGSANQENITEWFRRYEDIHPWRDGNGRTGSILHNWLCSTLDEPIHPPNLWDDPRRVYPEYPRPIL
jgi:fido (protein-threonine AMPylation protein)